jgi:hypothetical protein
MKDGCKKIATIRSAVLLLTFITVSATSAPPQLYGQKAFESPVHGDPDDLLLLAGYGFAAGDTVIYRAIRDSSSAPVTPHDLPTGSTPESGTAAVVSSANVPYSLTVRLPLVMRTGQPYALWVRTAGGEWSKAVRINDARPLWITPAIAYAHESPASLPRELKIVGRNLQSGRDRTPQIRLTGPRRISLDSIDDSSADSIGQYQVRAALPPAIEAGTYRVEFNRDGSGWVEVPDSVLRVLPDRPLAVRLSPGDSEFGGCRPDDGADDTACILRAIAAAARVPGSYVYLGPGTWDLIDSTQAGLGADDGIVVPAGVSLRGAGSELTRLARHAQWSERAPAAAAITVLGNSSVSGFTFRDLKVYQPRDRAGPFVKIGRGYERYASSGVRLPTVDGIEITGNTFDKTMVAIGNGGLPISRLFITYNTFGAFNSALELAGNRFNVDNPYRLDDSVIAHNVFKPGSKLDLIEKTGSIAGEIGAGYRVDFSANTADGTSTDFLYAPEDAKGWRAAFFWNMDDSHEELLVAQNVATCTGDKIGDGEAFAFDNNANTFAFARAPTAIRAAIDSVAVSEPLVSRQNGRDVPIARYYLGHWIQVVAGPGLGQARKIAGYSTNAPDGSTTFHVVPDWDVVPAAGASRIAVGREFWQLYAVGNRVDNRKPPCQKSNRSRQKAGGIVLWAQSADSVIAGNRQYDSDGIFVQQVYSVPEHPCTACAMESMFQSSLEISNNTIDGEYAWDTDCSTSGITMGVAAAPWGAAPPPTVGVGVSISHNTVRHADGQRSGAISQVDSWYPGPAPGRWPLSDNLIIQHNSISDIEGTAALPICGKPTPRVGIAFPGSAIAWRTVLYANSCTHVSVPVGPGAVDLKRICPSPGLSSCECP